MRDDGTWFKNHYFWSQKRSKIDHRAPQIHPGGVQDGGSSRLLGPSSSSIGARPRPPAFSPRLPNPQGHPSARAGEARGGQGRPGTARHGQARPGTVLRKPPPPQTPPGNHPLRGMESPPSGRRNQFNPEMDSWYTFKNNTRRFPNGVIGVGGLYIFAYVLFIVFRMF